MAVTLSKQLPSTGVAGYYSEKWLNVVRMHKDYLLTHPDTRAVKLEGNTAYRFRNDVFSLFKYQQLPQQIHTTVMIMNNMDNPQLFDEETLELLYPATEVVMSLYQRSMG